MQPIPVEKKQDQQLPIPDLWRPALKQLADFMALGFSLGSNQIVIIGSIDEDILKISRDNIETYPDALGELGESAWSTSLSYWTGHCWKVLIDLTAADGTATDLVLHAEVKENETGYVIEPGMIYVP